MGWSEGDTDIEGELLFCKDGLIEIVGCSEGCSEGSALTEG